MKAATFLLLFCVVLFCQVETNTALVELANTDARRDAIHDTSFNWILAGVCCNVFGIAAAAIADSQPPMHRFLGKSPEYIQIYTQTYKQVRRKRRIIPFLRDYIALATLIKYENPVSFAIAA